MKLLVLIVILGGIIVACDQDSEQEGDGSPPGTDSTPDESTSTPAAGKASIPPGDIVFDSNRTENFEIFIMGPDGARVRQITDDDQYDSWWPRLSPDRRQILFYRTPAGSHEAYDQTSLWIVDAEGAAPQELRPVGQDGWDVQGHAEWSPDGSAFVMFGGKGINPQIYITSATGEDARAVTDRGGQNLDPSWSPDGNSIYFVGCPRSICFPSDYEIYVVSAEGGEPTRLTNDDRRDHDPYVSPDGSALAWLTMTSDEPPVGIWGIQAADPDGSNARWVIDDGQVNSYPAWSSDGELIYFHRLEPEVDDRFSIFSIRPDGSDLREITEGEPGVNEYPDAGTP